MNVLYHPAENIREKGFAHITIRNDMLWILFQHEKTCLIVIG